MQRCQQSTRASVRGISTLTVLSCLVVLLVALALQLEGLGVGGTVTGDSFLDDGNSSLHRAGLLVAFDLVCRLLAVHRGVLGIVDCSASLARCGVGHVEVIDAVPLFQLGNMINMSRYSYVQKRVRMSFRSSGV